MLLKYFRELALVIKPNANRDICNGLIRPGEQMLRLIDPKGHQIGGWCHAKQLPKSQIKLGARQSGH